MLDTNNDLLRHVLECYAKCYGTTVTCSEVLRQMLRSIDLYLDIKNTDTKPCSITSLRSVPEHLLPLRGGVLVACSKGVTVICYDIN